MAEPKATAQTVEARGTLVDEKLTPTAEMHVLVGGPYTLNGEDHRYGHTALRVIDKGVDKTYDFGRYGRVTGDFGAEGEGILRVWSSFGPYIAGENALKRKTTSFVYKIFSHQAKAIFDYYDSVIASAKPRTELERSRTFLKVYQLGANYHALGYNCTTFSLDGAKRAHTNFESNGAPFIKPEEVLSFSERLAMKTVGGGVPTRLFLPANLEKYLKLNPSVPPLRVETHGG
jgi:hypothetical protein